MKTKSEIKHYYVGELLFVDYMDAYNYCVKNLISPDNIVSSYYYRVTTNQTTIKKTRVMRTMKKLSKKALVWCKLMNYDVEKIKENMKSGSFAVEKLETIEEMEAEGVDRNYPYRLFNPFNLSVEKEY